jgi:hypothetical protein
MIKLIPYIEQDGIRSLKDSELYWIYNKLIEDNTLHTAFFDGSSKTFEEFKSLFQIDTNMLYVIMDKETPVAICWITNYKNETAYIHYCGFKEIWGKKTIKVGREVLRILLESGVFKTLIGVTPVTNELSIRFNKLLGMEDGCVIPNLCFDYYEQEYVDGKLTYITSE